MASFFISPNLEIKTTTLGGTMRDMLLRIVMVAMVLFGSKAVAGCFPEQTIKIQDVSTLDAGTGISEQDFNAQIDTLIAAYGDEVQSKGYNLKFNRLWTDETINSDTTVEGTDWVINAYGGLARYKGMTADGMLLVFCHELGHHMGGAPLYTGEAWPGGGASVEGAADYFATLKCMKKIRPQALESASQVLANVLADLGGEPVPSKDTPDKSVVKKTYEDHPAAQCRYDTYLMGAQCNVDVNSPLSDSDPKPNSCFSYPTAKSYDVGSRPRCWFAPDQKKSKKQDDGSFDI